MNIIMDSGVPHWVCQQPPLVFELKKHSSPCHRSNTGPDWGWSRRRCLRSHCDSEAVSSSWRWAAAELEGRVQRKHFMLLLDTEEVKGQGQEGQRLNTTPQIYCLDFFVHVTPISLSTSLTWCCGTKFPHLFWRSRLVLQSGAGWSAAGWRTVWDAAPEGIAQDYREWTGAASSMLHCLAL